MFRGHLLSKHLLLQRNDPHRDLFRLGNLFSLIRLRIIAEVCIAIFFSRDRKNYVAIVFNVLTVASPARRITNRQSLDFLVGKVNLHRLASVIVIAIHVRPSLLQIDHHVQKRIDIAIFRRIRCRREVLEIVLLCNAINSDILRDIPGIILVKLGFTHLDTEETINLARSVAPRSITVAVDIAINNGKCLVLGVIQGTHGSNAVILSNSDDFVLLDIDNGDLSFVTRSIIAHVLQEAYIEATVNNHASSRAHHESVLILVLRKINGTRLLHGFRVDDDQGIEHTTQISLFIVDKINVVHPSSRERELCSHLAKLVVFSQAITGNRTNIQISDEQGIIIIHNACTRTNFNKVFAQIIRVIEGHRADKHCFAGRNGSCKFAFVIIRIRACVARRIATAGGKKACSKSKCNKFFVHT
ncbi:hypothetical protein FSU_2230 [Fibrobacter succinogenes subsp. succinogenes S85]|uniref:Uncharacterized protein n=1 Tax=Fibrobacter succinogenes (strain ATCC 19169 / S85) TaxID=59374 RepID=D9S400_FIBSS|nr:hypothetical protein FSU_2230 [Fibrobacter succinogenes subsp. succinogenes S85]